eukprot:COSAG01_NODE_1565_length_9890_cov_10.971300_8_plen_83_part_00
MSLNFRIVRSVVLLNVTDMVYVVSMRGESSGRMREKKIYMKNMCEFSFVARGCGTPGSESPWMAIILAEMDIALKKKIEEAE